MRQVVAAVNSALGGQAQVLRAGSQKKHTHVTTRSDLDVVVKLKPRLAHVSLIVIAVQPLLAPFPACPAPLPPVGQRVRESVDELQPRRLAVCSV